MKKQVIKTSIFLMILLYSLNASEGIEKWRLNYFEKLEHINHDIIDSDYSTFYRLEICDEKDNKFAIILSNNFEPIDSKGVSSIKKHHNNNIIKKFSKKFDKRKSISLEKFANIRRQLSQDYSIYYQFELYSEDGKKQLFILCKTSEELKKEAKDHLLEGAENAAKGIIEGAMTVKSGCARDAAAFAIEIEEAGIAFKEAYDEFKKAHDCYQEAKEKETEENK